MPNKLNDLTTREINEIRAKLAPEEKECPVCGKLMLMKKGQMFCSPKCRVEYGRIAARITLDKLVMEKEKWLQERDALVKEIQELRKQLEERNVR